MAHERSHDLAWIGGQLFCPPTFILMAFEGFIGRTHRAAE
jgi:hypothetical protein